MPKIAIKNATKKGYDEAIEGDSIDLTYPNSTTRRGRVGHQVSQTIPASDTKGVVVKSAYLRNYGSKGKIQDSDIADTLIATIVKNNNRSAKHQQDLLQSDEGSCRTIPAGTHASTPHLLKTITTNEGKLKIRKLTPKECWRLMGFSDEVFEKAQKVNSNTQLYKQAGNSIVVNVLVEIFKNLFKEGDKI